MMHAHRWIAFAAMAALWAAPASGASSAHHRFASSSHDSTASDSSDVTLPEGTGIFATVFGGGLDMPRSHHSFVPYIAGGGVIAAVAITQLNSFGSRGTHARATTPLWGGSGVSPRGQAMEEWPPSGGTRPGVGLPGSLGEPGPDPWPISVDFTPEPEWPPITGTRPGVELPGSLGEPGPDPWPISVDYTPAPDPPPISAGEAPSEPISSVPEPGTLVLFGGGILALLAFRATRKE